MNFQSRRKKTKENKKSICSKSRLQKWIHQNELINAQSSIINEKMRVCLPGCTLAAIRLPWFLRRELLYPNERMRMGKLNQATISSF